MTKLTQSVFSNIEIADWRLAILRSDKKNSLCLFQAGCKKPCNSGATATFKFSPQSQSSSIRVFRAPVCSSIFIDRLQELDLLEFLLDVIGFPWFSCGPPKNVPIALLNHFFSYQKQTSCQTLHNTDPSTRISAAFFSAQLSFTGSVASSCNIRKMLHNDTTLWLDKTCKWLKQKMQAKSFFSPGHQHSRSRRLAVKPTHAPNTLVTASFSPLIPY